LIQAGIACSDAGPIIRFSVLAHASWRGLNQYRSKDRDHYEPVIAMNEKRKRLLIELEDIIGHEFYNAKIQNWGPGGVFEGEGRELRYPVTFHDKDGKTIKTKHVDANLPAGTIMTGGYKLGQNELRIMRALDLMLTHLERKHGLHLGKTKG